MKIKRVLSALITAAVLFGMVSVSPDNANILNPESANTTQTRENSRRLRSNRLTAEPLYASALSATSSSGWDFSLPSLKDAYEDFFQIGNIMSPGTSFSRLNDSYSTADFFKEQYNAVTLENHMKPDHMMPTRTFTNFAPADQVVNWAVANDIDVIGHTLVWHSQSPNWVNGGQGNQPLTRAQARANMEFFINTAAGHFAGRVAVWDVVNEAFSTNGEGFVNTPGGWKNALRSSPAHRANIGVPANDHTNQQLSPWYDAYANGAAVNECGSDYIYDAFVFTRLADPNAVLYYNDFNEEAPNKRDAIAQMTEELNTQWKTDPRNTEPGRLLIEGIGMQSHHWGGNTAGNNGTFNIGRIEAAIERFAQTGARISITELDIPMGNWNAPHNGSMLNAAMQQRQASQYGQLFELLVKHADSIDRVTFWGVSDSVSWRHEGMPLLFDNNLNPKAAFRAVIDAAPEKICLHTPGEDDCTRCADCGEPLEGAEHKQNVLNCRKCENCDYTFTSPLCGVCTYCACGHEASAADCTKCELCMGIIPDSSHTEGAPATCTSAQTCTVCNYELAPVSEHDFPSSWTVRTSATTSAAGLQFKTCQREGCDFEITEVIPRRVSSGGGGGGGGGGGNSTPAETPSVPVVPPPFQIPARVINAAAGMLPVFQQRIIATGNQTLETGVNNAGQNAILAKLNAETGELEIVSSAAIGADGTADMNISQTGDYIILVRKIGDITGTGEVETADALALLRHIAGINELSAVQLFAANGRIGSVNTTDALNILKIVAGL
ncbi:MAG: endo-1,4-beta-xylanase [Oscillospiraceae bacterium]|jgi:GH35 family endo-1,4-beta-xylanase|nr:endo-1,4-beta-xylanase [Oscillospiraceae bacterium]